MTIKTRWQMVYCVMCYNFHETLKHSTTIHEELLYCILSKSDAICKKYGQNFISALRQSMLSLYQFSQNLYMLNGILVNIFSTEFNPSWSPNVGVMGRNSFKPLSNIWPSLHLFSPNSRLLRNVL